MGAMAVYITQNIALCVDGYCRQELENPQNIPFSQLFKTRVQKKSLFFLILSWIPTFQYRVLWKCTIVACLLPSPGLSSPI